MSNQEELVVDRDAQPILRSDLSPELGQLYDGLESALTLIESEMRLVVRTDTTIATCERFCARVEHVINDHPVLARVVGSGRCFGANGLSLLNHLCKNSRTHSFYIPAIKSLILKNPAALVWESDGYAINVIVGSETLHELLPWIAARFPWVFDPPVGVDPTTHLLLLMHTCGICDATIMRQFFESYPRGLQQVNRIHCFPLHLCFGIVNQADPELFKWMARQFPDSMASQDINGRTPSHMACWALGRRESDDLVEMCLFLATKCPECVRLFDDLGCLPIHLLLNDTHRPNVQKLIITLLRLYPQSADVSHRNNDYPYPRSVPFVQRIVPDLAKEALLNENIAALGASSSALIEAVRYSKDPIQVSAASEFAEWATARQRRFYEILSEIPGRLEETCRQFEGYEESSSDADSENFEEDRDDDPNDEGSDEDE